MGRTFPSVQWLKHHTSTAGGIDLIPGWGSCAYCAMWGEKISRRSEYTFFQKVCAEGQQTFGLIIREIQIQTFMRYSWQGCGEKENPMHCWKECKLVQPLWKTVWKFLKN